MKHRKTVTIGIPAYNEEENIDILLRRLLEQETFHARIVEIIVVSDGSTDATIQKARSVASPLIRVIDNKLRKGQGAVQNTIARLAAGDVLILLNADVLPVNNHLVERLVACMLDNPQVGLVGGNTASIPGSSFLEWVLGAAHELKQNLYVRKEQGNNVYMCHGRVRAFTRAVYLKIEWPSDAPEDAYSYLFCKSLGYNFSYARRATVYFRSPSRLIEHARQSNRFRTGVNALKRYFDSNVVDSEFALSRAAFVRTVVRSFLKHPFSTSSYILLTLYVRVFAARKKVNLTTWEVAHSSKKVVVS